MNTAPAPFAASGCTGFIFSAVIALSPTAAEMLAEADLMARVGARRRCTLLSGNAGLKRMTPGRTIALIIVVLRAQRRSLAGLGTGRGVSIAAVIALAFGAFSALFNITHPRAVMGIHDINDVLPIAILDAGALLWLVSGRRPAVSTTGG